MSTDLRVFNTQVSGSSLIANLSGADVAALAFANSTTQLVPITLTNDSTGTFLSANQWVQASIGSLLLNAATGVAASGSVINVGPDTASQAAALIEFFKLRSTTTDQRVLKFQLSNIGAVGVAATGYSVSLSNASSTSAFVQVQGHTGPVNTPTTSAFLYRALTDVPSSTGTYYSGPGVQRTVLLNAVNVNPGSECVRFDVLPFSY
jgi:hypothetical protein